MSEAPPPLEFDEAAVEEACQAYAWYEQRSDQAAAKFEAEWRRVTDLIESDPQSFRPYHGPYQRSTLRGFPYFVVYRRLSDRTRIYALVHMHENPRSSKRRVSEREKQRPSETGGEPETNKD